MEEVDKLSVIHVSGTKGKGSTCAFCEKIICSHGYKTGLFTSPHLIEVRERIRINGRPIGKEMFSHYFWKVYNRLKETEVRNCSLLFHVPRCRSLHCHVASMVCVIEWKGQWFLYVCRYRVSQKECPYILCTNSVFFGQKICVLKHF